MFLVGAVFVLTMLGQSSSFNTAEAKIDEKLCRAYYETYKKLSEEKFREKYKLKSFVNDCIKLYKDPTWYFVGKSKIDKNYENLNTLKNTVEEKKVNVKILSTFHIGNEKFLMKFRACADKLSIQQPSFLVKSKIEQFVATTNKVLQTGKCYDYHTQVKAKNSADIQIGYLPDLSKYQNFKPRMI